MHIVAQLPIISELTMNHCFFFNSSLIVLAEKLNSISGLNTLKITDTDIFLDSSNTEAACLFFKYLRNNSSLTHLDLRNTQSFFPKERTEERKNKILAQAITEMLQFNKSLTHLDISRNPQYTLICVIRGLWYNTSIVHLNMSNTNISSFQAESLKKCFRKTNPSNILIFPKIYH